MWTRRAAATLIGSGALPAWIRRSEAASRMWIVPFQTSPFPYEGMIPDTGRPFLDTRVGSQPAHTSSRAGAYPLDPTYSDRSVLLAVSPRFSARRPAAIVVYLHGNLARLDRDVVGRQQVVAQLVASHLDAVLVAPQFAVDAADSSAGHFWDADGFTRFMAEAAEHLAQMTQVPANMFDALPIILVAYSGGHNPAAAILSYGDRQDRVIGVVLLDALFDYGAIFGDWILRAHRTTFFFSAYSKSSAAGNAALEETLRQRGLAPDDGLPPRLEPGVVAFLDAGPDAMHDDFVTQAWVADPLRVVLGRVVLG